MNHDDVPQSWTGEDFKFGCAFAMAFTALTFAIVALILALLVWFR